MTKTWTCLHCKERVPHNLDICWNCGYDRQGNPPDSPSLESQRMQALMGTPPETEMEAVERMSEGVPLPEPAADGNRQAPQWEYCAVVGLMKQEGNLTPYYPAVWYFTDKGTEVVALTGDEAAQVGIAIARLGNEGWELVASGPMYGRLAPDMNSGALYFRRVKK